MKKVCGGIMGILETFIKGFACTQMRDFWKIFFLLFILLAFVTALLLALSNSSEKALPVILLAILISIIIGYFGTFWLNWKIFINSGITTKDWGFGLNNFFDYIVFNIMNSIIPLFNWIDKKILYTQIALYVGIILSLAIAANSYQSSLYIFTIIIAIAIWLLLIYNSLRFSLTLPAKIHGESGINAFQKSWELTKGKAFEILGINIVNSIFGFSVFALALLISFILFGTTILGFSFSYYAPFDYIESAPVVVLLLVLTYLLIFNSYVIANYYLSLRKEEKNNM